MYGLRLAYSYHGLGFVLCRHVVLKLTFKLFCCLTSCGDYYHGAK